MPDPGPDITALLHARGTGDVDAIDRIMPLVYAQLHGLAAQYMRREHKGHTLRTTALVHEAYLRLVSSDISFQDRAHFLAIAATTMRRILVDHARASHSIKRGSGATKITLDTESEAMALLVQTAPDEILDLNRALDRLAQQDERKAKLLEMYYFGGLSCDESAIVLAVSVTTVNRDLKMARAWLQQALRTAQV